MFSHLLPRQPGTEPLAEAFRACRQHLIGALVFSALANLLYLAPTLYMMQVYDRVVPTGGLLTLLLISVVAVFALGTLALLDWLRARLLLRASLRLDRLLAPVILTRLVEIRTPRAATQAMREFDTVRSAVSGQGILALLDAPWTPLYLVCCFLVHPAIGVLTLVGGGLLFALAVLNERDSRPRLKRAIHSTATAYAAQEGIIAQSEVVRALGMRQASVNRQITERASGVAHYADAQLNGGKYSGAIKFLRLVMQSGSLGLAAFLAVKGQISPGSIIAASVLLSRTVAPIEMLVGAWPSLNQARSSWLALVELFTSTSGIDRARTALPVPKGKLQVEDVTVQLPGTDAPQLRQISLSLNPGQTLGVVGPSGSGKTTLARVLAGGLAPTLGTIRLDGADYLARSSDDLASHIGYLPQVPSLLAGSIKDNISRFSASLGSGSGDIDLKAVAAAKAAGAHDLIQRLPQGYDTQLGAMGSGVSAGQAQRIALARALYGDPVLLVLDEPNSNLDQEGEASLMTAILSAAARGAAVVLVAHRAGVLSRVDRLATMADGTITMEGKREEVLARLRSTSPQVLTRPQ
ncbi:type I secretion system permease/ATPase [Brevundimonas subvibrioides]|uniref:Type I secretion system ATPase n=1 Tax=Brevundimonas subvibrioides (strain ATCC 15264 / DSM 4735 / LMG 14903 / NBRC 16000 / CB 81) TaxID=633149 RepID=D9QG34_BRESC|nr:type I secretion system permease/ATPase [Brevundimonas subvibrioides]ADL02576.1 type I secretion system ATPase [Brevundimonas subvibrioides ATCC 15264]